MTIADHTMDQFNLAIYSGLYATYLYMQKAYPHLKETKGSVVNFASGAGLFGNYGQCSYAAAKEGHPRLDPCCRQRVGQGRHQRQHRVPACLGPLRSRTSRMLIPRRLRPTSTCRRRMLRRRREGNRPRGRSALRPPTLRYMNGETVTLEGGMGQRPLTVTRFYEPRNQLTLQTRQSGNLPFNFGGMTRRSMPPCFKAPCSLWRVFAHMTQSAVKSHNGPADRLQSVGRACR